MIINKLRLTPPGRAISREHWFSAAKVGLRGLKCTLAYAQDARACAAADPPLGGMGGAWVSQPCRSGVPKGAFESDAKITVGLGRALGRLLVAKWSKKSLKWRPKWYQNGPKARPNGGQGPQKRPLGVLERSLGDMLGIVVTKVSPKREQTPTLGAKRYPKGTKNEPKHDQDQGMCLITFLASK